MHIPAPDFSLDQTLMSGQLFRWRVVPEGFLISHRDKAFIVSHDNDVLTVHAATKNVSQKWITEFFSLDEAAPCAVDEITAAALDYCGGMRICKQDPWECLVAFICSQNNNVKRIQNLMNAIAETCGTQVKVGKHRAYLFPNPGELSEAKLSQIRLGYRTSYLIAANKLNDSWLAQLRELSYDEANARLLSLLGVGPKVAACVLLFAYQQNSFPIDTWMEQLMRTAYGCESKTEMLAKAQALFGNNAGKMQQYLFHYARGA